MGMEVSAGLLLNPPNLLHILGQFLVRWEAFRILNLALPFPCFSGDSLALRGIEEHGAPDLGVVVVRRWQRRGQRLPRGHDGILTKHHPQRLLSS